MSSKSSKKHTTPSLGIQGMLNKKFFGKKSLKPKGKAAKKDKIEKEKAVELMD